MENPYAPGEPVFPVAAFNAPGYTVSYMSAFTEGDKAAPLPLFSYGAVGWSHRGFRVAAFRVDWERRQDLRYMPREKVLEGVARLQEDMPENRLRRHIESCALVYGCPAAKNFFLSRYEAPLPTAIRCNAKCLGCLSLQEKTGIPHTQERIAFTPSPEEIAEIAVYHIRRTRKAVVSFGQGCEGEPLLAAKVIAPAIRLIRRQVQKGTINMNTNGSRPQVLERLLDGGLDAIRVSMNSVRKSCYEAYFRPAGYQFEDVVETIDMAGKRGTFVSINYFVLPGFTDDPVEVKALMTFLETHPVSMIQWRNLNFDPVRYWQIMAGQGGGNRHGMGIVNLFDLVRKQYPTLKCGYFNPPKEKFRRNT
jgi:pyruvate-formate lyase-activating enzyme